MSIYMPCPGTTYISTYYNNGITSAQRRYGSKLIPSPWNLKVMAFHTNAKRPASSNVWEKLLERQWKTQQGGQVTWKMDQIEVIYDV